MRTGVILASFLATVPPAAKASDATAPLPEGAYEVEVRLELPNVEAWAARRTATICLPVEESGLPLPVLSEGNPLAKCPATNVETDGASLIFSINCEGRDAARGRAHYTLSEDGFEGRILMIMGGKNMVMTEVQRGRRIGECEPSTAVNH